MKRLLILSALITLLVTPSLWADDDTVTTTDTNSESATVNDSNRKHTPREERLKKLREKRAENKEKQEERNALLKECRDQLEAATTEDEKKAVLESCKVKPASGIRKELNKERKGDRDDLKELKENHGQAMKALRVECKALRDAATDETEDAVKADCKAKMDALKATHKAEIEAKKMENYSEMLTKMKTEVEKKLALIQSYSDARKTKLKADLTKRLEKLKTKATENNDTAALTTVTEIEALLAQF